MFLKDKCSISLTSVSASMKTHLEYCVRVQQWSLVKVTPRSGLFIMARCAVSPLSSTSTTLTSSKILFSTDLKIHNTIEWITINNASGKQGWERMLKNRCDLEEMLHDWWEAKFLTGKVLTLVDQWVPPTSWMYCGYGGTCPKPWLPEHSCHW